MASIGGYVMFSIDRLPDAAGQSIVESSRPGIHGVSARTEGLRAPITTVTSRTIAASAAAVETVRQSYAALKGSLVTVVDDFGNIAYNVMVRDVRILAIRRVGVANPAAYAIVECQWELYRWL